MFKWNKLFSIMLKLKKVNLVTAIHMFYMVFIKGIRLKKSDNKSHVWKANKDILLEVEAD